MTNIAWCRRARFIGMGLLAGAVAAQPSPWQIFWTDLSPPTLARADQSPASAPSPYTLAFDSNGDLLVSGIAWLGYDAEIFRLSPSGEMRWSSHLGLNLGFMAPFVAPDDEGGAFVASEGADALLHLDASGSILWTRRVPTQWIASTSPQTVVAGSCQVISSMSKASGSVVWQRRLPGASTSCTMTGLISDGAELYASARKDSYYASRGAQVSKLDSAGQIVWQHDIDGEAARLVGIDGGRAYVVTDSALVALDAANGTTLWQAGPKPVTAVMAEGNSVIPVIVTSDAVLGIAPGNGSILWSRALAVSDAAAAIGQAVFVNTALGLVKLDAATGATAWTAALPTVDSYGHPIADYVAFGGLHDGQFLAVARVTSADAQPPPFVLRVDFATGQLSGEVPVPATLQGSIGTNLLADGHLISIRVVQDAQAPYYRLSSVDPQDGVEEWTRIEATLEPGNTASRFSDALALGANHSTVAASISEGAGTMARPSVATWALDDGAYQWRVGLQMPGESWLGVAMSEPRVDGASNVFVSMGIRVGCPLPDLCAKTALYALNAVDGSVRWQRSFNLVTQIEPPYVSDPAFTLVGQDAILDEVGTLLRLNGADGSVEWSVDIREFDSLSFLRIADDGNILAVGFRRWGKFDSTTGALLWSAPSPSYSCFPQHCSVTRTMALSSGDLLQMGYQSNGNLSSQSMIVLLHTDGSGSFELWFPTANSPLYSNPLDMSEDAVGQVWLRVREWQPGNACSPRSLTRLDLDNGELEGRQVLGCLSNNPFASNVMPSFWIDGPNDDRLLASLYLREPPMPNTLGTTLVDTEIAAEGNLLVTAALAPGPFMAGESAPFEVVARYIGSAPINHARLDVVLPWGAKPASLSCALDDETSCSVDARDGDLHADVSLQPGSAFRLGGMVPVLDTADETTRLAAVLHGPAGLLEQDLGDNFAMVVTTRSLFHGGFD